MFEGCVRTLDDVRYVPELKSSLLSFGVFDKSRCTIKILRGEMKITKGVMTIMKGTLQNGLYTFVGNTVKDIDAIR